MQEAIQSNSMMLSECSFIAVEVKAPDDEKRGTEFNIIDVEREARQ